MKARYLPLLLLLLLLHVLSYGQGGQTDFIENKGQWDSWIKYKAITMGGEVHMEKDGFRYLLADPANVRKIDSFHTGRVKDPIMRFHVYKMTFEGANEAAITGDRQQKHYYNYYLGNDPAKWKSDIHPYLGLDYNDLYKGINMHLSSEVGSLIYEFFVQPNADASQIKLRFDGAEGLRIKDGNLQISTSVGQVVEMKPVAYQYINNDKVTVACNYRLKNDQVTFELPDGYDHTKQLIIDPTIAFWCSFTGSTADNWGFTATYDAAGNFYLGGLVNALAANGGGNYPVSPGAYQSTFAGGQSLNGGFLSYAADLGIMKLSPDGVSRIYATYIGGSANERPHSMVVDNSGNLIIAGKTRSTDYPVTAGAYQSTNAGAWDMFVTKLNATGTALIGSTYIGGSGDDGNNFDSTETGYGHLKYNYGDDARSEVQIDNAGNIYVAGCTGSNNFPVVSAFSPSFGGGLQDGVAFKMNGSLTSLIWSTYLGGTGDDAAYVLAFNNAQTSLYVAGGTNSTNFPVGSGGWQSTYQGDSADGFILKIQNGGSYGVQNGSFIGTSNFDQVYGVGVDINDNVYLMGQSLGGTFPVTAGAYSNPSSSQFVMKMNSTLSYDLISTVYGSGDPSHTNISPVAFLVDTCQNVYISGWGGNIMAGQAPGLAHSGTTTGMPVTSDAHQATTDGFDFYFVVFAPGITSLRYATFYGRNDPNPGLGEHVDGGTSRFSKQGIIYQAICANCGGPGTTPFPTTAGVWAPTDQSSNCNEAGLKISFNIGPVTANPQAGPSTSGCAPLTVNFTNTSTNALSYVWNFDDGSATTSAVAPTHVFTAAGVYTVSLAATNSNACFRTDDTVYLTIVVDTNIIKPAFTYTIIDSCNPYVVTFANNSVDNVGTPTYQWWLGDGTTYSGTTPPIHSYPDQGTYQVMMVMTDAGACNSPDTVIQTVRINGFRVSAHADLPDSVCEYTKFTPFTIPTNATSVTWTFGDGKTSTEISPGTLVYDSVGTFTITIVALNPESCNGSDTFRHIITVFPVPVAAFTYSPVVPEPNVPTSFTNESVRATRYLWDFGDNLTSVEINPVHQYNITGNYKVCLTAYNNSNCPSTVCKTVSAEVMPLIGLPTGFSPNGDGENDILYVRGAAIATLDLKIFNRWGQLVFETTTKERGWDGTFNGQPQPIEAYGYVLDVTFIDGSKKLLKGNITLLR